MNNKCISLDMNGALEMLAKLQFERFKACLEGDEQKENAFNEEINRLSAAMEAAVKELENK